MVMHDFHDSKTMMRRETGKWVDLGLFTVISPLCIRFYHWKFLGPFAGHLFSSVSKFHEKAETFMVITPKYGKILMSLSFSLVYISLVGSITIANGQIEWSYSTDFNRIQDGAWLK